MAANHTRRLQTFLFVYCIPFPALPLPKKAVDDFPHLVYHTFVCTDENDDWLNIYANYDLERDAVCDTLELNLCKGDGSEENWSYHLNAAEQEVLVRKMEAFCQQQNSMSLHDFARQLQEEPGPTPQMQM